MRTYWQELNLAWHRLDAWKDVAPGFPVYDAVFSLRLARTATSRSWSILRAGTIFVGMRFWAEIAGDFKPKPRVYLAAAEALNLQPGECMMVAAHSDDLAAAAALGLRTGHVARPGEKGPGTGEMAPKVPVDVAARSFEDLADKLAT